MLQVKLKDAVTAVAASQFTVKDAAGTAIGVSDAQLAGWDGDKKTVVVTLNADTVSGTLYTISSGDTKANFGGRAKDTTKPEVKEITSNDYNEVKVVFNEPVKLDGAKFELAEKYGSQTALAVSNIKYSDSADTIILTTADQKGSTLYSIKVKGTNDFAGNAMDDKEDTFVGTKKSDAKLEVSSARAIDYKTVLVNFNEKVDTTKLTAGTFKVTQMYGDKSEVAVTAGSAKLATSDDVVTGETKEKAVIFKLTGELKSSTLYKLEVSGLSTLYGVAQDTDKDEATLVGVDKPSELVFNKSATMKVEATSNTEVTVKFENKLDKATAENIANYAIAESYGSKAALTVTKAALQDNGKDVKLTVAAMKNVLYGVTVTNVKDIYGNTIKTSDDANKTTFVGRAVAEKIKSVSVTRDSDTTIILDFDQNVGATYSDVSHYVVDNSVGYPEKAESVDNHPDQVKLTIPKTTEGKIYKVTVKGLENSDGVLMDADGVSASFVGKGNSVSLVSVDGIVPIDKNAFEVFFDRPVDDATVQSFIWDNSGDGDLGVTGKTTVQIKKGSGSYASLSTHMAYKDPANANGLIVRYTGTSDIQSSTNEVVTIKFTSNYVKDSSSGKEFTFASSNSDPAAPKVTGIIAENKYSVLIYFDQPMDESTVKNANIAVIDAKGASEAVVVNDTQEVTKVNDTTYRYYVADLTTSTPASASADGKYYLRLSNAVKNKGGISVNKESDSDSNQYVQFGISTGTVDAITNIQAMMTDKRTVQVYFPVEMLADGSGNSVKNVANYKFVDGDSVAISGAPNIKWATFDKETNTATLYLDADMPSSTKGHYLVVSNAIQAKVNSSVTVKNDGTYASMTGVKKQFALSGTDATAPKIVSAVVSGDRTKLTVTFEKPVVFATDTDGVGTATDTLTDDIALDTTPAVDKVVLDGTADGTIAKADVLGALKIVANLTIGGQKTLTTADLATNATLKKDGKTIEIALSGDTFKPGTSGTVSTDVAVPAAAAYSRVLSITYVAQKTGDDKSEVSFGVGTSNAYDTTAPQAAVVSAKTIATTSTITISFDEAINAASKTTVETAVKAQLAGGVPTTDLVFTWNADGTTVTIKNNNASTVSFAADATVSVTDLAGNTNATLALDLN